MKLKEQLAEIGLSAEQAQKIIDEVINGSYMPKSRFNEINEENKTLKASLAEQAQKLAEQGQLADEGDSLRAEIARLGQEREALEQAHGETLAGLKMDNAIALALTQAKARNIKAVKAMLDTDALSLGEDGAVTGLAEQIDALKQSDGYLFETAAPGGQLIGFQPGAAADGLPDGAGALSQMTYSQMAAYLGAHPDVKL